MIVFLVSLPRGALLFLCALVCVVLFGHAVSAGELGDAVKALVTGAVFAFLLYLRRA